MVIAGNIKKMYEEGNSTYVVYMIRVGNSSIINYVYLVVDLHTRQAALIDPAWNYQFITHCIQQLDIRLTSIFLTHSHLDHTNLVNPLLDHYAPDAKIYMSEEEIDFYRFTCKNLIPLKDGDTLFLGETPISIMLTPGHTVGSACYVLQHSCFTGDTVFIEGCGTCDTLGGDPHEIFHSVQKVRKIISPYSFIYPGHSFGEPPGHPLEYLLKNNIYFQIEKEEEFVKFRMRPKQPSYKFL
ncbi:MBL fold metallo-hydrolase [Paenibacillus sp.]|jgi:glyoxylase-like metal-dependent hydrolase (beta-lactamase superfamily II)|uniref:MBL fold metallo-hydrolase n=1 Tax=Paenibacillus sp. TaxID=58172 RepID=UPI0028257860|nr:MBL fold metallo-hydrolase [Paenibacillus sp.]MDR0270835.1 MBL fold metallo-hydrolase [Paenibacillus sp.]